MKKTTLLWLLMVAISISALAAGVTNFLLGTSQRRKLIVSTTTSLYDTGLLDVIKERFEERYPIDLYFISLGTGQAIEHAKRGDADLILVHAPSKELTFLSEGYGVCRKIIAYNFFAVVGPPEDAAGIRGLDVKGALGKIVDVGRAGNAFWISRGDESGTHLREKTLWGLAGFNWPSISQEESWYIEAGGGMGKTLLIANEREAYTLSDIGTYMKYYEDNHVESKILVGEEKELLNVYSAIAVNHQKIHGVNFQDAVVFIKFLISDECQDLIASFKKEVYGRSLFYPAARLLKENFDPIATQWIRELAFFNGTECPEEYRDVHSELYEEVGVV